MVLLILGNVPVIEIIVPLIFWLCVLISVLAAVLIVQQLFLINYVRKGLKLSEQADEEEEEKGPVQPVKLPKPKAVSSLIHRNTEGRGEMSESEN